VKVVINFFKTNEGRKCRKIIKTELFVPVTCMQQEHEKAGG